MDQRPRTWLWSILIIAASLTWLLPGSGTAGMPERFAALGIPPSSPRVRPSTLLC
ncbi:MAG: hypothetical protein ACRERE_28075 [Candidatus Entotheonellia bacterium]